MNGYRQMITKKTLYVWKEYKTISRLFEINSLILFLIIT